MAILAYQDPVFQPAMRIVATISNSNPAAVTTTFAHQYITGTIVRLNVPAGFGMPQINQMYGPIIVTGDSSFTFPINSTNFAPFISQTLVGITGASGTGAGIIPGTQPLIGLGQTFNIGYQLFTVVAKSGALLTTGSGVGTMNMNTGVYDFSGCAAHTNIYWTGIGYPDNRQSATVTAIGENNDILYAAERNSLPYSAL